MMVSRITIVGVKYYASAGTFSVVNSCGWCRQLFCYNSPLNVIADDDGRLVVRTAEELPPLPF